MSLALWLWRIYWDGTKGSIVRSGVRTILREVPQIPGLDDVEGIDYIPRTLYMIRHTNRGWKEMEPDEINACWTYLYAN